MFNSGPVLFKKFFFAVLILLFASVVYSSVPGRISYEGRLLDSSGAAVTSERTMTFKIYSALTGGSVLWTSAEYAVTPNSSGVFNVLLGSNGDPIDRNVFASANRFLEVTVAGEKMNPRTRLAASPFAFRSAVTDTLDGFDSTDFILTSGGKITGPLTVEGTAAATRFSGDGSELTGIVATGIADGVVTTTKLANNAVTGAKLADAIAITTTGSISAGSVVGTLYGDGSALTGIQATSIADNAVTESKIATGAVTAVKIANNNITGNKLNSAIDITTTGSISAAAVVGTALYGDGTNITGVTATPGGAAGGSLTGTYPNPTIANTAVDTDQLANSAVTAVKIANNNITGNKLNSAIDITTTGSISAAAVVGTALYGDGTNITGVTATPGGAAGGSLTGTYPNPTIANTAVDTDQLANSAVTAVKIANNNITGNKLNSAIDITTTGSISAAAVVGTTLGLSTGSFQGSALGNGGVIMVNSSGGGDGNIAQYFNALPQDFAQMSIYRPGGAANTGDFQYYALGPGYSGSGLLAASSVFMWSRSDFTNGIRIGAQAGPVILFNGGFAAANERVRIDTTGYVGIGNNNPQAKLHVNSVNNYRALGVAQIQTQNGAYPGLMMEATGAGSAMCLTSVGGDTRFYNHSSTGNFAGSDLTFVIALGGNTCIGTDTTPDYKLDVEGTLGVTDTVTFTGLGTDSGTNIVLNASNQLVKDSSSLRYKKDIVSYDPDLAKIDELRPVRFKWNEKAASPGKHDFGLIAEEVYEVFPEIVAHNAEGQIESVNYAKLSVILLKAMQEQRKEIEELKKQIAKISE